MVECSSTVSAADGGGGQQGQFGPGPKCKMAPKKRRTCSNKMCSRGVASNEAEEAVASSLFCARTRTHIGDIVQN